MAGISDLAALSLENNYLFNGKLLNHKEFSDNTGLDWYSYGMREYDPQIGRFFRVDPLASKFPYLTPYQYASDDPISNIDVDGLEGMKFFLIPGGIQEFALENTLYKRNVAKGESPQEASKQAEVQSAGIKAGVIADGTGTAYLLSGSGVIGAVRTLYGLYKGVEKLQSDESGSASTEEQRIVGRRRQNKLPDKGEPNSTQTNEPGTTIKKYGSDGNVQKEFNKGHQGENVPENEKSDHVHDYKPNPNNPMGRGDRQPGRPLKRDELKKDFNG